MRLIYDDSYILHGRYKDGSFTDNRPYSATMDSITAADPRLLTKVCKENFTTSEIIFNMINSDEFRIVVEDLEIIISDKNRIQFDTDDYTSFDNLTFDKPMYAKFERLLGEGWVTIKSVKIKCKSEFTFLLKYSKENIQCNGLDLSNLDKITEYKIILNEFLPNQVLAFAKKIDKSKKITLELTLDMHPGEDASGVPNVIDQFKEIYQKSTNFKFNFFLGFSIDVEYCSFKSIDSFKKNYDIIMKYKENHPKANIEIRNILLRFNIGMSSSSKVSSYLDYTSSVLNTKLIKNMIILDEMRNAFEVDLTSIKKFKDLETALFNSRIHVNYKTLGDLRDLKKLKSLVFTSTKLDYGWMSEYLPSSLETLTWIQPKFPSVSKLKIPPNFKKIELHANGTNRFDFDKIDFENANGLERIILLPFYKKLSGSKAGEIIIEGMETLPESVKYVLVEGKNLEQQFLPLEKLKITGVDVSGIYSNVGSDNKYLCLNVL